MKVLATVAEYNPFHNGHKYNLDEAKRITGADYCIAVMTGDFVQRGEPAIINKYARAKMALSSGVDLVLELPVCYGCASAEYFAKGAIALLDKLGVTTSLVFGSECGMLEPLSDISDVLIEEPEKYRSVLQQNLRQGRTFPFARNIALTGFFSDKPGFLNLLSAPNNILGIEYIKALKLRNSKITPLTIQRQGSDYHNSKFSAFGFKNTPLSFPSALSIRTALDSNSPLDVLQNQMPGESYKLLMEYFDSKMKPLFRRDFSILLHYKLLEYESTGYEEFADVSKELSARIQKNLRSYKDYDSFCDLIKTKDVTYTRVSRALLHILLDIKKNDYQHYIEHDYLSYASVLGFKSDAKDLLSEIKKKGSIPLLTKNADASKIISPFDMPMFESNIKSSHIYQAVLQSKSDCTLRNMYQMSPVIL